MSQRPKSRGNLESRGNYKMAKTFSRGFGVVRILTPASQHEVHDALDKADLSHRALKRKRPLHATVIGFVGMSRREQTAFNAGFNVSRLEERLENATYEECPRRTLTVELGSVAAVDNILYSEIDHPGLVHEQLQLAGQVALHGISLNRINRKVVPPHLTIGYAQQGPIEELREQVEKALLGQTIALQKWDVYPERYA